MGKQHFCTPQELAGLLRLTEGTIYNMIKDGEVAAKKFGRSWRIPMSEVVRLVGYDPFQDEDSSSDSKRTAIA
jgi:excisionase family DNA binding protein